MQHTIMVEYIYKVIIYVLQATAIQYGSDSNESEIIKNTILSIIEEKLGQITDNVMDEVLTEYINIHNILLNDVTDLINKEYIRLDELLLNKEKLVISYEDFIHEYSDYLKNRRCENIYKALCYNMKKNLIIGLISEKIEEYIVTIEEKLKQVEPAPIIAKVGSEIRTIIQEGQEMQIGQYSSNSNFTNFDDDKATPYITEAFPPCVKKALMGAKSGGRNYYVCLFLTPFLSYSRLYPGVYARHIRNPKITDNDPTLSITQNEILPLIYEAADNCQPPLFKDQPEEKQNIHSKLGFGEGNIKQTDAGKTPWYTPINCQNIKQ